MFSTMTSLCDTVGSFFGIDRTCSSTVESTDEPSNTGSARRRKLRHDVWSSNDAAWAKGLVERYNAITLPLLRSVSEVGIGHASTDAKEQPARIPKTIHFIWLGSQPIPRHFKSEMDDSDAADSIKDVHMKGTDCWNACMKSWLDHHPPSSGWSIRLWTEREVEATFLGISSEYTMANRNAYEYALSKQNYGLASDILRVEVLSAFGGVYVDIDYLCTAPFDDLHSAATFYCGASNVGCIEINNGLMGSAMGHTVTQRMISKIGHWFDENVEQEEAKAAPAVAASVFLSSYLDEETAQSLIKAKLSHEDVIRHTGPGLITKIMMGVVVGPRNDGGSEDLDGADRTMVLPAQYFHALPNTFRGSVSKFENCDEFCESNWWSQNTAKAVHLWGCSWQK